jgi:hypothetical protein
VAGTNQWRLTLPTIPAATTTLITFTGQLAANLSTLPVVTSTLTSSAGAIPLSGASVTHLTDGVPPTTTVLYVAPPVLRTGANAVYGQADDGTGIGVAKVEIRRTGTSQWQVVTGTTQWQGALNVPSVSTFSIDVRATDLYNQSSPIQVYTFAVDNIGPNVSMTLPAFLTSTLSGYAQIGGTTADPFPANGQVTAVEIQVGSDTAPWFTASGPYSPTQGSQGWNFRWPLPIADGVAIGFHPRATDAAGNLTVGAWQTTTVDTVAPVITVTTFISNAATWKYLSPARSGPPIMRGSITDGGGISQLTMRVSAPDGTAYADTITRTGSSWSYTPYLHSGVGSYWLTLVAIDLAGNTRNVGPYRLKTPTLFLPLVSK